MPLRSVPAARPCSWWWPTPPRTVRCLWTTGRRRGAARRPLQRPSLRLRTGKIDDLAPFFRFFGHELPELGGRHWEHVGTQVAEPRFESRIGEGRVDLLVEQVDDLRGRVLRCAHALKRAGLEAGHEVAHG